MTHTNLDQINATLIRERLALAYAALPCFKQAAAAAVLEQVAQIRQWGEQNHEAGRWLLILQEEIGEVAKAALEGDDEQVERELIQVAAVALSWYDCCMRHRLDDGRETL